MHRIEDIETDHGDITGYMDKWECVINKDHFKVWRQLIEGTQLYQYKGTVKRKIFKILFRSLVENFCFDLF